jgi:hypothetical protein
VTSFAGNTLTAPPSIEEVGDTHRVIAVNRSSFRGGLSESRTL